MAGRRSSPPLSWRPILSRCRSRHLSGAEDRALRGSAGERRRPTGEVRNNALCIKSFFENFLGWGIWRSRK